MRVGLFTESYDPVINGVSTSVKTLAAELLAQERSPLIVAPRYPDFEDRPADGIEVRRLPSWRTVFNPQNPFAFPPIGPMPEALRTARIDIVHTQQPFGIGQHGRRVACQRGLPLVSTFHTLYHEYAHYWPFTPRAVSLAWLSNYLRRYYAACGTVIVPSAAAGRCLEAIGVAPHKLVVIPTGVPEPPTVLPMAVEEARRRFEIPDGAPVVLFVGRIAREKNLELLFDAFARLPEPTLLLLAGSGPHAAACQERVARMGLTSRVRFAGFLRRTELGPVYAAARVFAFPSATDTQGVVLAEAQSLGLPCVVVDGGGAPEFVRAGVDAEVVAPTVDAFHAALVGLLSDEDRRRAFAQAARESPLRPTPREMARRMIEVYETALPAPPGKESDRDDEELHR